MTCGLKFAGCGDAAAPTFAPTALRPCKPTTQTIARTMAKALTCMAAIMQPSLVLVEPFGELDVGAERVGQKRDCQAEIGCFPEGDVELHARRLKLLAERFEVPDLEADVIDDAALGAGRGRRARRLNRE